MSLIVAKFGGTSLCDGRMFKRVKRLICACPARRVIVVSAPGKRSAGDDKVTDMLMDFERSRSDKLWRLIVKRFMEIARTLEADASSAYGARAFDISAALKSDGGMARMLGDIRQSILAGAGRMYAASRGEYLSAKLLARALDFEFLDAANCVRFTERGALMPEATYAAICARVSIARGTVIPGYYGVTPSGEVTTFPRGGSDITGALAARALIADAYENWTDVDGVYTSDPARGENAGLISQISYQDMLALCARGATVIHPDSLAPVMEKHIPIIVRNTFRPDARGTRIHSNGISRSAEI